MSGLGVYLAGVGALGALLLINAPMRSKTFSLARLINPTSVEDIAALYKGTSEDGFIWATWDMVAQDIRYAPFGSTLFFLDHTVKCEACVEPERVLAIGEGNCVGKSLLLASILRNRLPASRVYVAVGELYQDGVGGHAWVQVLRSDGTWYILESTKRPQRWVTVASKTGIYVPLVLFNDRDVICDSPQMCLVVKGAG